MFKLNRRFLEQCGNDKSVAPMQHRMGLPTTQPRWHDILCRHGAESRAVTLMRRAAANPFGDTKISGYYGRRWGSLLVPPTGQNIDTMTAPDPALKETILLVDDEQSVRAIVLKILRRAHYNVLEAENGEAALRIAEAHPGKIDLVITDMYMPGLRGPEVVERLAPTRPGLRALFISGYADQDARTGVPGGANFLNKPFSGQELASAVEKVLKGPAIS